jgi:hypothetical protein
VIFIFTAVRNSNLLGPLWSGIIKNRVATGKNMGPKLNDLCGSGRDGVFHVTREGLKETVQEDL